MTSTPEAIAPRRIKITYQGVVDAVFAVFIFSGMIAYIEPSPYDLLVFVAIPIWFLGGFKIHRVQIVILFLWCIFEVASFLALLPYWDESETRKYQFTSFYLFLTVICFTLFFGQRTIERTNICLKAFTIGAVIAAVLGILSYLGFSAFGIELIYDRVASTFKDPNVFGSYLILAEAYVLQALLLGIGWRRIFSLVALLVLLLGVFVSYSRGSWGASILTLIMVTVLTYLTSESKATRRRIAIMSIVAAGVAALVLIAILAREDIRDFFFQRATLQDYDEGATGRFGNQLRSIPMLLDRPEGFGPFRFRQFFGIEPHSSYIGAFANDGWIGGIIWILIVVSTTYVGFRLVFFRSPYRDIAQVVWPALFSILLQAFQIDIDHWRQIYLLFGMIWGFEAARLRWLEGQRRLSEASRPLQATYV
ncbi:MAG: O-antigen ligase family protein [Methylovirgula sp.]